ncbi:protein SIEVE ELEMENT OCCLUSION C-like [Phoenix dactylifera]|uniref:Protein SIEVE ELEMENT OCCLUSION C-like n=1 Tax=Phoenix dactylifera TaxID=42345 RepID=A0A8B8ZXP4_PHODC|nr:protein SIEVE ELEMENT OCCLUSION C-like [Phoenix dactylifera]
MQSNSTSAHFLSSHEDILMKKILQTHMPDDYHVDSAPLLHLTENIIHNITMPCVVKSGIKSVQADRNGRQDTGIVSTIKQLGQTIHHISCEMLRYSSMDRSLHATTMAVLELLGKHSWSTKLVIVLAAVATSFGELWLIMQLYPTNPLALSIGLIKGLRNRIQVTKSLEQKLKAFRYLVEKMVSVTKCMVEFEMLPVQYTTLDYDAVAAMKTQIHQASYWVIRSSVACASQITSLAALGFEQVHTSTITATWELWSSARKVGDMDIFLRKQLDIFHQQIEKNINSGLSHLFEEAHLDNQKVLSTLFALKDDYPLRDYQSQEKVGVVVLRNKEVILFISTLTINLEKLLLIIQQLQNHPQNGSEKPFVIVWVPIVFSIPWSNAEERAFKKLANIIPWYSLYEPSKLSLSVIKFIKEAWHFQGGPIMVVLDSKGKVTSLNAMDMISIWGLKAYPFSVSRERELWEEQNWTIEFLLDDIDPLISYWMQDGRVICLYGSNNIGWVQELTNQIKDITKAGVLLELIYAGSNYDEDTRDILATIIKEKLSSYLSQTKIRIFWLRLNSILSSKLRLGNTDKSDFIMSEANSLLSFKSGKKGWLLVSKGSSTEIIKLYGNKVLELLSLFPVWGHKVGKWGFMGAIRKALDPPSVIDHCNYYSITPYIEDLKENILLCKKCKCPMEKNYMYQCKLNT